MFPPISSGSTNRRPIVFSCGVHAAVLLGVIAACYQRPLMRIVSPGERAGAIATVVYSPANGYEAANGRARASAGQAAPPQVAPANKPSYSPVLTAAKQKAGAAQSPDIQANADAANGLDSLGDGDVRIALGAFVPQPRPDLSIFPHGFEGDVIIDVLIDATGVIRKKTLVRGISPQVDQTVMATLESWRFTPAERNGEAIPSEQELLFHYGPV